MRRSFRAPKAEPDGHSQGSAQAWVTLALAAGVPLELVQRVTGHRTVSVVLKHYFRPGREDFRQVLSRAMPKMLGESSERTPREEMRALIDQVEPKALREQMLSVWKQC